jgi:hypothetical protein
MSTKPPEQPPEEPGPEPRPSAGFGTYASNLDLARMSVPGNAEILVYLVALIVAMLVVWIADRLDVTSWFQFFLVTTAVYILSRGIAKASRVLEH